MRTLRLRSPACTKYVNKHIHHRKMYEVKISETRKGVLKKSVVFWVITRRHTTPCNNPEDRRFHQHRGGSLKSRSAKN